VRAGRLLRDCSVFYPALENHRARSGKAHLSGGGPSSAIYEADAPQVADVPLRQSKRAPVLGNFVTECSFAEDFQAGNRFRLRTSANTGHARKLKGCK